MTTRTLSGREQATTMAAPRRRARVRAVARVVVGAVIVSELITIVLVMVLIGDHIAQGMLIALICSAPVSGWIADREFRLRHLIAEQRDRLSALNEELNVRYADLDAFARAVAHDLKNPLTAIIGLADAVGSDPRVATIEDSGDSLRSIVQSGNRAVEIVDGLLLLHGIRYEEQELTRVDSEAVLAAALDTMAQIITESGTTVIRSGDFPAVHAHHAWLVQVWVNLISNAVKYGGSPPVICLTARTVSGGFARFAVEDNGEGIALDDRSRVFNEFQRNGRNGTDGHGLGLAIVDRIVTRLGGAVGVDDAAEGGSAFWFTVPLA